MKKYFNPVKIIFGQNKFKKITELLKNKKYIVITHKNIKTRYATELINSNNSPLEIIKNINPNPDYFHLLSLQENILATASQLVKTNGNLVYATCSILKDENKAQIQKFLENTNDWVFEKEKLIIPSDLGDGFYFSILKRK